MGKLSKYAKLETIYFCLRYGELKEVIEDIELTIHSPLTDQDGSHSAGDGSTVETAAIKAMKYRDRINLIEKCTREVTAKNPVLYPYLLNAITKEECTFDYLYMHGMPICRNAFYRYKDKLYTAIYTSMYEQNLKPIEREDYTI